MLFALVIVTLAAKRIIGIATTTTALRAIVIAGETDNRKDTLIMCTEDVTRTGIR